MGSGLTLEISASDFLPLLFFGRKAFTAAHASRATKPPGISVRAVMRRTFFPSHTTSFLSVRSLRRSGEFGKASALISLTESVKHYKSPYQSRKAIASERVGRSGGIGWPWVSTQSKAQNEAGTGMVQRVGSICA